MTLVILRHFGNLLNHSRPLKLAPLQTSLRHVRRSAHNADSRIPRITRTLKCAPTHLLFSSLGIGYMLHNCGYCFIFCFQPLFGNRRNRSSSDGRGRIRGIVRWNVCSRFFSWSRMGGVGRGRFLPVLHRFRWSWLRFSEADGKGGGKIVIAALFCQFCCFFHAEAVAFEAAFATFGTSSRPFASGRIPVGRSDPLSVWQGVQIPWSLQDG